MFLQFVEKSNKSYEPTLDLFQSSSIQKKRAMLRTGNFPVSSFSRQLFTGSTNLAGHSKWANIRHIKGAKDAEKSMIFNRYARQMRLAIQGLFIFFSVLSKSIKFLCFQRVVRLIHKITQHFGVSLRRHCVKRCPTARFKIP